MRKRDEPVRRSHAPGVWQGDTLLPLPQLLSGVGLDRFFQRMAKREATGCVIAVSGMPVARPMLRHTAIAAGTLLLGWIIFTRVEGKFVYHI